MSTYLIIHCPVCFFSNFLYCSYQKGNTFTIGMLKNSEERENNMYEMIYKNFKDEVKLSRLGMGNMRLPVRMGEEGEEIWKAW